jgi:hypothetical protein
MDSEVVKAKLAVAAAAADEATHFIREDEGHALEDIGIAINAVRKAIDAAIGSSLNATSKIEESKEHAHAALIGAGADIGEAIVSLEHAHFDQTDLMVTLNNMKYQAEHLLLAMQQEGITVKDRNGLQTALAAKKFRDFMSRL